MSQSSEEFIKKTIRGLGLTEAESKVYFFLAKKGLLKGRETAQNLKMPKAEVYHLLKSLQSKGWVQSTLEFPARFSAIPLGEILDSHIKLKREETKRLENTKKDVVLHWSSLDRNKVEFATEKFVVIEGRNKIFVKIFQMIEEAKNEIDMLISGSPLVQAIDAGTDRIVFKKARQSQIQMRLLTQVSIDNFKIIGENLEKVSNQGLEKRIEVRHLTESSFYCRFLIKDKKDTIFFLTPRPTSTSIADQEDAALWTNSIAVVNALEAFFEELWFDSRDISEKLKEIVASSSPSN